MPHGPKREFWRVYKPDYPHDLETQLDYLGEGWKEPASSIWDEPGVPSALMYKYVVEDRDEPGPTEFAATNGAWDDMAESGNI